MTDKHSASFKALRKECHKSAKADKQAYWSNVACEMEKAAARNNSRKLYQLLGESTGKRSKDLPPTLLSKDNKLLTSKEDRIERWRAHFQELLHPSENDHSQPIPSHSSSESPSVYEDCNIAPPSREEIIHAVKLLKNNKSPGIDELPAELLKAPPEVANDELHNLPTDVRVCEYIPEEWRTSVIIPVFKKGDRADCTNYGGISLMPIFAKVFTTIVLNRFRNIRNDMMTLNQAGFLPGMGCCDHIFSLRQILEHCLIHQQETIQVFIDFLTAFESVTEKLLSGMR